MERHVARPRRSISRRMVKVLQLAGWRHSLARSAYVHRLGRGRYGPVFVVREEQGPLPEPKTVVRPLSETTKPLQKLPARSAPVPTSVTIPIPMPYVDLSHPHLVGPIAVLPGSLATAGAGAPAPAAAPTVEPAARTARPAAGEGFLESPFLRSAFTSVATPTRIDAAAMAAAFDRALAAEGVRQRAPHHIPAPPPGADAPFRRPTRPARTIAAPATAELAPAESVTTAEVGLTPAGLRRRPTTMARARRRETYHPLGLPRVTP